MDLNAIQARISTTTIDEFARATLLENEIVMFLGLEDLYLTPPSVASVEENSQLLQYIADLYIRGNMILQQLYEIEQNVNNLRDYQLFSYYHRSWPYLLQTDIPLQEVYSVLNTCAGTDSLHTAMQNFAKSRIETRARHMTPSSLKHYPEVNSLAACFMRAKEMRIGTDYSVVAVNEDDGPTLRVQLKVKGEMYGLKQFLELRHGCELTDPNGTNSARPINRNLLQSCESCHIILRADEIKPSKTKAREIKGVEQWETQGPSHTVIQKTINVEGGKKNSSSTYTQPTTIVPKSKYPYVSYPYYSPYKYATPYVSPEINSLILKKEDLHTRRTVLERTAQMVHILRVPIGDDERSPLDIRCDGFVERARTKIEEIALKTKEIDEKLARMNPTEWPVPSSRKVQMIAFDNGVNFHNLQKVTTHFHRKSTTFDELVTKIRESLKPMSDNCSRWMSLLQRGMIKELKEGYIYVLAPDTISEATRFLNDLERIELPPPDNRIQLSHRYIADCSFYVPKVKHFDERGLLKLEGAFRELFAICDPHRFQSHTDEDAIVIGTANKGQPFLLAPNKVAQRIARELVRNGLVNCQDANIVETQAFVYETLIVPCIYNLEIESEDLVTEITKMQGALMDYGSYEWTHWLTNRLLALKFHDSVLSFYRRSIAEREFCLRDEMVIKRIRNALTNPELPPMQTKLQQIAMDAFVNSTIEKIIRGERLVELQPHYTDEKTADKLARFIRSRRMPPTEV
ncbi:hypothetical protein PRIPAC_90855 [Pristionchus pacificus]|nr:hypothetical protein PRIPAC_90855 [Pristionchus pacificus]